MPEYTHTPQRPKYTQLQGKHDELGGREICVIVTTVGYKGREARNLKW